MRLAPLLGYMCVSALLTLEANLVAAAEQGVSTAQAAAASEAGDPPASGRHPGDPLQRAQGQNPALRAKQALGARQETPAPQHDRSRVGLRAAAPFAAVSGRLHSMPAAKARLQAVRDSSHFGSTGAAENRGRVVSSPFAAHAVGQPNTAASKTPDRAPTTLNATARASTLGGPESSRRGALSGPGLGRPTHNVVLDGAQLHRKF